MHDADAGRNELECLERLLTPFQKLVALAVALELHVEIEAQRLRRTEEIDLDRMIDHEINRNERLDNFRIPFSRCTALRMAARSTTSGTPVKSCRTMRATTNGISSFAGFFAFHFASVSTSLRRTFLPSQLRNTDSSTMRMLTGNREILPRPCSSRAGNECKNPSRPFPASNFFRVLNSSFIFIANASTETRSLTW